MKARFIGIILAPWLALWLAQTGVRSAGAAPEDQAPLRVAVIPVATINVTGDEAEALAERLRQDLGRVLEVEVLSRDRLHARVGVHVKDSCMSQPACVRDLGTRLEADQLLFLAIIRIGERIQIDVTWADARTGSSEAREPVRLDSKDLKNNVKNDVFERAAPRLLPGAAPRSPEPHSVPPDSGPPPAMTSPGSPTSPVTTPPVGVVSDRPETGRQLTTGVWIAGGIGVAALVGGSVFGLQALGTENKLEMCQADPECDVDDEDIDDLALQRDVSDVMFVAAVAAGVTAGILYWRSGKRDTRVGITATPSRTALTFSTRF
jgi:hypothetical protein